MCHSIDLHILTYYERPDDAISPNNYVHSGDSGVGASSAFIKAGIG
jgi:hypothetical protein